MSEQLPHICSSRTMERCPSCGHEDTRDGFECYVAPPGGPSRFAVICPICEAEHPDQSNHDDRDCEACWDAELDEMAARRA